MNLLEGNYSYSYEAQKPRMKEVAKSDKPEITYKAIEIHNMIIMMALNYMKEWKLNVIDEKEEKRNSMLKELGFINSKSLKDSEMAVQPSARKRTFDWYQTNFPDCIFLKVDDFVTLLQKYNLVCGHLYDYEGEIPYEKLEEIKEVKETLDRVKEENIYSNVFTDDNVIGELFGCTMLVGYKKRKSIRVDSTEAKNQLDKCRRYPFYGRDMNPLDNTELFIAAPAHDMKSSINDFHIKSEDPFMFQLFPYGVVIYSKWGDEANDPILKDKAL